MKIQIAMVVVLKDVSVQVDKFYQMEFVLTLLTVKVQLTCILSNTSYTIL